MVYADDILLYKPIEKRVDYDKLQLDIDAINNRAIKDSLTFNESKCKYIIATKKVQPLLPNTNLRLGGVSLEKVDSYQYLGVQVTSRLS